MISLGRNRGIFALADQHLIKGLAGVRINAEPHFLNAEPHFLNAEPPLVKC
jgi:hypothetical protein